MPLSAFAKGKPSPALRGSTENTAQGSVRANWPVVWFCEHLLTSSYGYKRGTCGIVLQLYQQLS